MFKTSKTIGKNTVSIEADDLKKLCFLSSQLPNLDKCDVCESTNIGLSGREADGNAFYAIRCGNCGAEYKLGQKKTGGLLFFREGTKFEKYSTDKAAKPAADAPTDQIGKAPWEK
jgi:hypothetical protein